ncbi:DNA polymerase III subunit gamma/tau [Clostridium tetani]|uniref:DNA-directed DNA polymerase n=1 Tax=Clostridium tetani TaxID=1513 RepID=A0ABY0ETB2_CLOTA|nr:DNA polymerase III subunit gamma/tau [Clostridium tetani]CDI48106.1 DNA polymerase III subunits gamma and tau [Clostridium tetani 12124569]KHO40522.1 DNA polymerase III subunit gamma/tau [Clostridium tetani]RXI38972.1 DNA polymerase III subunit gamma/tau [Clostridium tetani]RXI59203.1 DNA polymerase III subunit gamma/tau [Clostridium tetani]RXI71298.1 DNA polymerase III subunit gamma/tau [Clostridium tetani]
MAYTALYREWRPSTFEDVVGQKHITITLKNQIKNERIAHAYLFCGTRGTGKTSTAKILAKAVNCLDLRDGEPCNECEICKKINSNMLIDIEELDAASNNSVDNIRSIIEEVYYPPREAKYKVYIMDEVHMLSTGAVNAFLKTLEEPPSNVIFILATTDPQKLPITILSRCQRFDFKRIKSEEIFQRLRFIMTEQGFFADDNSLRLISRISDGAMRDALGVLDQVISTGNGRVEYEDVVSILGLITNENLIKLTDGIIKKDIEECVKIIEEVIFSGKDSNNIIKDLILHMRNLLIIKVSQNPYEVLDMSEENIALLKEQSEKVRVEEIMRFIRILQEAEEQSKWVKQSRVYLELAIIKMCKIEYDTSKEIILSRLNMLEEVMKSGEIKVACESITSGKSQYKNKIKKDNIMKPDQAKSSKNQGIVRPIEQFNPDSKVNIDMVRKYWKDILETFKGKRLMVIYASLMTAVPLKCINGEITLMYGKEYAFNKQRLEKENNSQMVENIFSQVLKDKVRIKYIIEDEKDEVIEKDPEQVLKNTFGENIVEIIEE